MLTLPNYSEDCIEVRIFKLIKDLPQTSFFVTVDFVEIETVDEDDIANFVLDQIDQKSKHQAFKIKYQKNRTILVFTFISTQSPLNKKFSLINSFVKLCHKCR